MQGSRRCGLLLCLFGFGDAGRLRPLLLGLDPVGLSGLDRVAVLVEVGAEIVDDLADRRPSSSSSDSSSLPLSVIRCSSSAFSECRRMRRSPRNSPTRSVLIRSRKPPVPE